MTRLKRSGFSFRMPYDEFLSRYKMMSEHTWPQWRGPSVEGVTYLLRELKISASDYAFGRTKIFVRSIKTVNITLTHKSTVENKIYSFCFTISPSCWRSTVAPRWTS